MNNQKNISECKGKGLACYMDHTLLKAQATTDQIEALCREAMEHKFTSVCVNACYTKLASEFLKDSEVKVCTVIGFPLGSTTTSTKSAETEEAIANGADEVDMVINIGALKSGLTNQVKDDIAEVVKAAGQALVKVIIETCFLTDEEKVQACSIAKETGADFVKTSTGFGTSGATIEDIRLMRETVGPDMGVKASGGIGSAEIAEAMIKAGATRLGTSSSIAIISGEKKQDSY